MATLPKVMIVGGPDVDARLELMHAIHDRADVSAVGSLPALRAKFEKEGFKYNNYTLDRRSNPLGDIKTLFQLFSIFRDLKPQIVHTFDTKPSIWGRLAARMAGVPVVIGTIPGLGSLYTSTSLKGRILRSIYELLQKITSRISDLTIFQNDDDARQFVQAGVVPRQKAMVILGSGINTEQFFRGNVSDEEKDRLKREFNLQPGEIIVTMISRIIRTKGILEFVEAARRVRKSHPNVRFLLIGGEDRESMDRLSDEEMHQLKKVVDWRGRRSDVPVILSISNIFVLPSVYREGVPRALLEAASMELPIVTTNTPGCKDVVEDKGNGLLIQPNDTDALAAAITKLVEDPVLCRQFGMASRKRAVKIFDTSVTFGQMRKVYEHAFPSVGEKAPAGAEAFVKTAEGHSAPRVEREENLQQTFNGWWTGLTKRTFDIVSSFFGLLILSPLFAYIAYRIKRDSPGPVFFRGSRMGRNMRPFKILKFRTMYENAHSYAGSSITAAGDDRITPIGHWLRDTKINELPQLWNVLKGDMSVVGPRPEDVEIARGWPADAAAEILSIRPGITSPASIMYRDEEKILAQENHMADYIKSILPDKLRLDRLYYRYHSFFSDIDIIFWTLAALSPTISRTRIPEGWIFSGPFSAMIRRNLRWFTVDLLSASFALLLAGSLWSLEARLNWDLSLLAAMGIILGALYGAVNILLGINRIYWSKAHIDDAIKLMFSWSLSTLLIVILNYARSQFTWFPQTPVATMVLVTGSLLAMALFMASRYRFRLVTIIADMWLARRPVYFSGERVIIAGEGEGTQIASWLVRREMFRNAFYVVGVVSKMDPLTYGMKVDGLWMLGGIHDLPFLLKKNDIGMIISTLPRGSAESQLLNNLTKDMPIRTIHLADLMWLVDQQVTRPSTQKTASLRLDEGKDFNTTHDSLTGLLNWSMFDDRLRHTLAQSRRNKTSHAVLFVKLTGFEHIKDALDLKNILKSVSQRITRIKREVDTVTRYNENSFALILDNVPSRGELIKVEKRILNAFSTPVDYKGQKIQIKAETRGNACAGVCPLVTDPKSASIKLCYECVLRQYVAVEKEAKVERVLAE